MKRFVIFLLVMLLVGTLMSGCSMEEEDVIAVVTDMQFVERKIVSRPFFNPATKTSSMTTEIHPEKYLVTITYEDVSETFDNQELYEKVSEGDEIMVTLYQYYLWGVVFSDDIVCK